MLVFNNNTNDKNKDETSKRVILKVVAEQGCPSYMEDRACSKTLTDEKWGSVVVSFVADGHGGNEVSSLLKKSVIKKFKEHFQKQNHPSMCANIENLDHIMISVIRDMNIDLQKKIVKKELQCGSTLVATFAFLDLQRLFVFNCGDSRFMMFETESGKMVNTVSRIIDLQDGLDRSFEIENLHPCCTHLHKVLGKVKFRKGIDTKTKTKVIKEKNKPGSWSVDYFNSVEMINDTKEGRGIREWALWLDNEETNPNRCLQFIHHRKPDEVLVIGREGRLNITRAFGDITYAMHMGEIYIASIPTDREVAFLLCSDGIEDGVDYKKIGKFLFNPEEALHTMLFSPDHAFRKMCDEYNDFFIDEKMGLFPEGDDLVKQLDWFQGVVQTIGLTHLPIGTQKSVETIHGAIQWIKWAYNKFSVMPYDNPRNKFHNDFHENVSFRLNLLIQAAICRISADNISGILISLKPEDISQN